MKESQRREGRSRMAKEKACKQCKTIYSGVSKCPACESTESSDTFKGRVVILKPEESEIAKELKVSKKGEFAIKLR
jgi:DNA-directed RNA polymerase subunit E"